MRHILPFFKEEELVDQDLSVQTSLEMKFQDKHLVRCLAFAKHRRRLAINICQKDIAAGIFCVLTESDTHFTIWREQPSEKSQKVGFEEIPTLPPTLNKSQPSRPKEEVISSQTDECELVYAASPPVTVVSHLAADSTTQPLKPIVVPINTSSQPLTLPHRPILAASKTKPSKSKTTISNPSSPSRSTFLALFNQELAQHIGPIADYLINELIAKRPNIQPQQMIEAIVAEIPDPKEAQDIQKSLERLINRFTAHKIKETL